MTIHTYPHLAYHTVGLVVLVPTCKMTMMFHCLLPLLMGGYVYFAQDVLVVLRDIQGSINSLASNGGARLQNSSASGSTGSRALPARASAVGKLR